jgi:hypothetical protein
MNKKTEKVYCKNCLYRESGNKKCLSNCMNPYYILDEETSYVSKRYFFPLINEINCKKDCKQFFESNSLKRFINTVKMMYSIYKENKKYE